VLQFSEYCATWWEDWKSLWMAGLLLDLSDGVHAYAAKQASILHNRAKDFAQMWKTPGVVNDPDRNVNDIDQEDIHSDED
jgi:hypothetical protein